MAKNTVHVVEALLRLRQVACHSGLVDRSSARDESAKLDTLLEHLQPIVEQGKKTLVSAQFTTLLDLVGEELAERDIAFERLDGATRDRKARVERFQKDGAARRLGGCQGGAPAERQGRPPTEEDRRAQPPQ